MKIRRTQQGIKHTLTERWYAWEAAWKAASSDPEVDLNAQPGTSAYKSEAYEVFHVFESRNVARLMSEGSLNRRLQPRMQHLQRDSKSKSLIRTHASWITLEESHIWQQQFVECRNIHLLGILLGAFRKIPMISIYQE